MAVDKLVDSAKLNAALEYEANKIIAKGGGTAPLAFDLANGKGFGDYVDAIPSGGGDDGKWKRPSDWPDIDSLIPWTNGFSSFDGIYCTFDNTGNNPTVAGFYCVTDSGTYTVERGHVANGSFVADATTVVNSGGDFAENYANCGYDYPVYYVHATTGHFTSCKFRTVGTGVSGTVAQILAVELPCLELVGHIGYCSAFGGNGTDKQLNNRQIRRCHVVFGDKVVVTSLQNAFTNMFLCEEIDFSYWDTSNWEVTSLGACFNGCSRLKKLDLTSWNVSKWAVTAVGYCFYGIDCLEELDLSGWDTRKFAISSLNSFFTSPSSLETAKISVIPYALTSGLTSSYPNDRGLKNYWPMSLSGNQSYNNCYGLTHDSLLRILNALPNGSYTLTLGNVNKNKLTAAEIAIATDKGWTVA